jgi:hypothetical protein
VPSTEEKKKTCYECKCEDFCVPGPSLWCGRKCESIPYGESDSCGCADGGCCLTWNLWKPRGCAQLRTRKVLVAHEVKKEVPSYKWEVEYLCDECRQCCVNAMPFKPGMENEIVPVSAETPLAPSPKEPVAKKAPAKQNWWSQLFGN